MRNVLKKVNSEGENLEAVSGKMNFQVIDFWDRLDVISLSKNAELTEQLVQSLCKTIEYYADKMFAFLAHYSFYDDATALSDSCITQVL